MLIILNKILSRKNYNLNFNRRKIFNNHLLMLCSNRKINKVKVISKINEEAVILIHIKK
jgi:hypothetical protein